MDRRQFTLSSLWALAAVPGPHSLRNTFTAPEIPMHPLTIDLQAHPHLQFRIDAFTIPAASRAEFEAAMRRNLAFLETLPGFLNHMVFEKTSGPTTFNLVTIAVWESAEAIAAAGE